MIKKDNSSLFYNTSIENIHLTRLDLKTIYCISGLGADERAFSKLKIMNGFRLQVIIWLLPKTNETIEHYAKRMSSSIVEKDPILLGLSFGGIMCIEIAKLIQVKKIIIVSSIKTAKELPTWMKAVAFLKLNKIVPLKSSRLSEPIQNRFLGISDDHDLQIARHYRKNADLTYVKWAVDKVVNWKSEWVHPAIYHIHGDNDKMFPSKNIKPTYLLKNAGHFMILNKADEVGSCINKLLLDD